MTVDGLNGNELSGSNRMNSSINLDAIAEVKVLLNTYKAEFGHSGGANIEIVSKSGSTNYAGSAYYYGKRDKWNASPWENNRSGLPKPRLHVDTPGFNIGGPVWIPKVYDQKDNKKLFFFYSFEAPQVQRPGPGPPVSHADGARAAGGLLADPRRERPPDLHQGSQFHGCVQRDGGRPWLLSQQPDSGEPARPERPGAAEADATAERHQREQRLQFHAPGDVARIRGSTTCCAWTAGRRGTTRSGDP